MCDVYQEFKSLVQQRGNEQKVHIPNLDEKIKASSTTCTTPFMREAYLIFENLIDVEERLIKLKKQSLVKSKNSSLGPVQYNQSDKLIQSILLRCMKLIENLKVLAKESGSIFDMFSSKDNQSTALKNCVVSFVNSKLLTISQEQKNLQQLRLKAQLEAQGDYNPTKTHKVPVANTEQDAPTVPEPQEFSKDNQQLLKENEDLLKKYEASLDQIQQTERLITDISEMQTALSNQIEIQTQKSEAIYGNIISTVDSVEGGNKYLLSARSNSSSARKLFTMFMFIAALTLLFLDWYGP